MSSSRSLCKPSFRVVSTNIHKNRTQHLKSTLVLLRYSVACNSITRYTRRRRRHARAVVAFKSLLGCAMRIAASGSKAIVPFQVHDYGNHSWVILQKPAENEIQKICENDGSYLFLQQFDKFLAIIGNGRYLYLLKYL